MKPIRGGTRTEKQEASKGAPGRQRRGGRGRRKARDAAAKATEAAGPSAARSGDAGGGAAGSAPRGVEAWATAVETRDCFVVLRKAAGERTVDCERRVRRSLGKKTGVASPLDEGVGGVVVVAVGRATALLPVLSPAQTYRVVVRSGGGSSLPATEGPGRGLSRGCAGAGASSTTDAFEAALKRRLKDAALERRARGGRGAGGAGAEGPGGAEPEGAVAMGAEGEEEEVLVVTGTEGGEEEGGEGAFVVTVACPCHEFVSSLSSALRDLEWGLASLLRVKSHGFGLSEAGAWGAEGAGPIAWPPEAGLRHLRRVILDSRADANVLDRGAALVVRHEAVRPAPGPALPSFRRAAAGGSTLELARIAASARLHGYGLVPLRGAADELVVVARRAPAAAGGAGAAEELLGVGRMAGGPPRTVTLACRWRRPPRAPRARPGWAPAHVELESRARGAPGPEGFAVVPAPEGHDCLFDALALWEARQGAGPGGGQPQPPAEGDGGQPPPEQSEEVSQASQLRARVAKFVASAEGIELLQKHRMLTADLRVYMGPGEKMLPVGGYATRLGSADPVRGPGLIMGGRIVLLALSEIFKAPLVVHFVRRGGGWDSHVVDAKDPPPAPEEGEEGEEKAKMEKKKGKKAGGKKAAGPRGRGALPALSGSGPGLADASPDLVTGDAPSAPGPEPAGPGPAVPSGAPGPSGVAINLRFHPGSVIRPPHYDLLVAGPRDGGDA
eukprot:tig00021428_g21169.t1